MTRPSRLDGHQDKYDLGNNQGIGSFGDTGMRSAGHFALEPHWHEPRWTSLFSTLYVCILLVTEHWTCLVCYTFQQLNTNNNTRYGKIYDIYFPPAYLRLFDGPACNIVDMWRILGRAMVNGGLVVGTIIKPKLGLRPKPFGEACYAFWQGEPSGQPGFLPDERMHS